MSDTPRTDAHVRMMIDNDISPEGLEYFARDLERELAETATEMQALRTANAGLMERVKRLEEVGDGLRKASRVFLLSFVDDDYGADDGTPIDRVDPDASVQWEEPPTAGEHVQLQNAINKWNQAKGQP